MQIVYETTLIKALNEYSLGPTVRFIATGTTPAEVFADAERQRAEFGGAEIMAVGLNNSRAEWEAVFGVSDYPDSAFGGR